MERHSRAERAHDYRAGILVAVVEQFGGAKNPHPFDHFPWNKKASDPKAPKPAAPSAVRQNMRAYMAHVESLKKVKNG
jgi:hypothetical protein